MVEKYIETLPFTASVFIVALTIVAVLIAVFLLLTRLVDDHPVVFAIVMLLSLAWLLTHEGCSHPIGNTIALIIYVASGVLLALPWAIEKLEPYLTEREDQQ